MSQSPSSTGLKVSAVIPVYNERYPVADLVRLGLAVAVPETRELAVLLIDDVQAPALQPVAAKVFNLGAPIIRHRDRLPAGYRCATFVTQKDYVSYASF